MNRRKDDTLSTKAEKEQSPTTLDLSTIINPDVRNTSDTIAENNFEKPKYFNGVEISKLTKRQIKKYNKMLKWETRKKEKRANERLKTKKRKMEAKLNNVDLGPSRKQLKRSTMANSPCKISVVIDLSFDHLMIPKVRNDFTLCRIVL